MAWSFQKTISDLRVVIDTNVFIEVLNRLGLKDNKELFKLTRLFAEGYHSVFAANSPELSVVKDDPDDNKFIECAVELESRVIISGDNHLREIRKYIDIEIISPRELVGRFGRNSEEVRRRCNRCC